MAKEIKSNIRRSLNYLYKKRAYIMLSIIGILIIFIAYEYYSRYFNVLKNPRHIKRLILSYGKYSIFVFIALQILQVVAFFIPGEVVQIAGGYIYGTFLGSLLSILGITMGGAIVYAIVRTYGKPLIKKIISEKHIDFYNKLLKVGSKNYAIFLLYLIPGIPKDVLGYICGISDISFRNFMLYSTLGRIPGIFISAYFGAKIYKSNKGIILTLSVIMTLLFIIGLIKGEKIIKKLTKKRLVP